MFFIYIKPVLEKLQEEFFKFFNLVQFYHIGWDNFEKIHK